MASRRMHERLEKAIDFVLLVVYPVNEEDDLDLQLENNDNLEDFR